MLRSRAETPPSRNRDPGSVTTIPGCGIGGHGTGNGVFPDGVFVDLPSVTGPHAPQKPAARARNARGGFVGAVGARTRH